MALHHATFDHIKPTDDQLLSMNDLRLAAKDYARAIEAIVPDGPDKTYILRELRGLAMWVNVAITRNPDGSPRT